jgi:hypothetical protein
MPEKRRNFRVKTRFEILFSSRREEGTGVLADISESGALVENASLQPQPGGSIRVHIFLPNRPEPFELLGHVTRHTERGFAIEYEKLSSEVCRLLEDAAAIVAVPQDS